MSTTTVKKTATVSQSSTAPGSSAGGRRSGGGFKGGKRYRPKSADGSQQQSKKTEGKRTPLRGSPHLPPESGKPQQSPKSKGRKGDMRALSDGGGGEKRMTGMAPPGLEAPEPRDERLRRNWRDRDAVAGGSGMGAPTHHSSPPTMHMSSPPIHMTSSSAPSHATGGAAPGMLPVMAAALQLSALPLHRMKDAFPMILESVSELRVDALSTAGRLYGSLALKNEKDDTDYEIAKEEGVVGATKPIRKYSSRELLVLGSLPRCHAPPEFVTMAPEIVFPKEWASDWMPSPEMRRPATGGSAHAMHHRGERREEESGEMKERSTATVTVVDRNNGGLGVGTADGSVAAAGSSVVTVTRADAPNWRIRTPQMGVTATDGIEKMDDLTLTACASAEAHATGGGGAMDDEWVPPKADNDTGDVDAVVAAVGTATAGGSVVVKLQQVVETGDEHLVKARHFTPELKPTEGEYVETGDEPAPAWGLEDNDEEYTHDFEFRALDASKEKSYMEKHGELPKEAVTVSLDEYESLRQREEEYKHKAAASGSQPSAMRRGGDLLAAVVGDAFPKAEHSEVRAVADHISEMTGDRKKHKDKLDADRRSAMYRMAGDSMLKRVSDAVAAGNGSADGRQSTRRPLAEDKTVASATKASTTTATTTATTTKKTTTTTTSSSGTGSESRRLAAPRLEDIDRMTQSRWKEKYGSDWYRYYVAHYKSKQSGQGSGSALDSCKTLANVEYYKTYYLQQYRTMQVKAREDPKYINYVRYYEKKLELVATKKDEIMRRNAQKAAAAPRISERTTTRTLTAATSGSAERSRAPIQDDVTALDLSALGYTRVAVPSKERSKVGGAAAAYGLLHARGHADERRVGGGDVVAQTDAAIADGTLVTRTRTPVTPATAAGSSKMVAASAAKKGAVTSTAPMSGSGTVEESEIPAVPTSAAASSSKATSSKRLRLPGVESLTEIRAHAAGFARNEMELRSWAKDRPLSVSGRALDDYLPFYQTDGVFTMRSQRGTLYLLVPVDGNYVRIPFWFLDGYLQYCEQVNPKATHAMLYVFWRRYLRFKYEQNEYQKALQRMDGSAAALAPPPLKHEKKAFLMTVENFRRFDKQRKEKQQSMLAAQASAHSRMMQSPPGYHPAADMYMRPPPERMYGAAPPRMAQPMAYVSKEESGGWPMEHQSYQPAHGGTDTTSPSYYPSAY